MKKFIFIVLFFFFSLIIFAENQSILANAAKETKNDILKHQKKLSRLRDINTRKRILLNRKVDKVSDSINSKKKKLNLAKSLLELDQDKLEKMRQELQKMNSQFKQAKKFLIEQRKDAQSAITPFQVRGFNSDFEKLDKDVEVLNSKNLEQFYGKLFRIIQKNLINSSEIYSEIGDIINEAGEKESGKYLHLGAFYSYFLGEESGFATLKFNNSQPHLFEFADSADISSLKNIIDNGKGFLPVDLTGGTALDMKAQQKTLFEHLRAGGVIIYPLFILATMSLFVGVYKTFQLIAIPANMDVAVEPFAKALQSGNIEEAKKLAACTKKPLKNIFEKSIKYLNISREQLEEQLNESILGIIPTLDKYLPVLSVSAAAAPLLGLLGTVMGMIKTFELISVFGTGDPKPLSGGISEALITTEVGLFIAIPILIWYAFLNRRLRGIIGSLEKSSLAIINALSQDEKESTE